MHCRITLYVTDYLHFQWVLTRLANSTACAEALSSHYTYLHRIGGWGKSSLEVSVLSKMQQWSLLRISPLEKSLKWRISHTFHSHIVSAMLAKPGSFLFLLELGSYIADGIRNLFRTGLLARISKSYSLNAELWP
jgi:hypothetical protein